MSVDHLAPKRNHSENPVHANHLATKSRNAQLVLYISINYQLYETNNNNKNVYARNVYICKCTHRDKPEFQVRNGSKCDSYKSLSFLARSLSAGRNVVDKYQWWNFSLCVFFRFFDFYFFFECLYKNGRIKMKSKEKRKRTTWERWRKSVMCKIWTHAHVRHETAIRAEQLKLNNKQQQQQRKQHWQQPAPFYRINFLLVAFCCSISHTHCAFRFVYVFGVVAAATIDTNFLWSAHQIQCADNVTVRD